MASQGRWWLQPSNKRKRITKARDEKSAYNDAIGKPCSPLAVGRTFPSFLELSRYASERKGRKIEIIKVLYLVPDAQAEDEETGRRMKGKTKGKEGAGIVFNDLLLDFFSII